MSGHTARRKPDRRGSHGARGARSSHGRRLDFDIIGGVKHHQTFRLIEGDRVRCQCGTILANRGALSQHVDTMRATARDLHARKP